MFDPGMAEEIKSVVPVPVPAQTMPERSEYVAHLALRRDELRTDIQRYAAKAMEVLNAIVISDQATNRAKIDAAKALLEERARSEDRCFGKAAQAVHVTAGQPGDAPAGLIILPALEAPDDDGSP